MRVLLDTCVWGGSKSVLQNAGHDVIWSGDWITDPGDQEILKRAFAEERILVTLDKDFAEWAIVFGEPHCGIIRLVDIPAKSQAAYCLEAMMRYAAELRAGAILTIDPQRTRVRLDAD